MEDEKIIDSENWKNQTTFSYKEIVLKQVSRIASFGSKEMRGGYWKTIIVGGGSGEHATNYVSDTRKEYISAVQVLHDLLLPKFDKDMTKVAEEIHKDIEEVFRDNSKKGKEDRQQTYIEEKLDLMREMFQELCGFLERFGWLESGVVEE